VPIHRSPSPPGQHGPGSTSRPLPGRSPGNRFTPSPPPQESPRPADIGNFPRTPISPVGNNALYNAGQIARYGEAGRAYMDPPGRHGPPPAPPPQPFTHPRYGPLVGTAERDRNPRYFTPNDVQMVPLRDHVGRPNGVIVSMDPQDIHHTQRYAAQPGGRPYTFLAKPGTHRLPHPTIPGGTILDHSARAGTFHPTPGRPPGAYPPPGRNAGVHPPPKEPFHIVGHTDWNYVDVTLTDGTKVAVNGANFARIAAGHNVFQNANAAYNPDSYLLLGCRAGLIQGPGGTAYDFQSVLSQGFNDHRPVHSPTEQINDSSYMQQGVPYVNNGGRWNTFGGP
jgi:hypothetical protein